MKKEQKITRCVNIFKSYVWLMIIGVGMFSSCVKDGEDLCPEGAVTLHFYVEKFRNRSQDPLADREPVFSSRVKHLRYYLYHEDQLRDPERVVDVFPDESSPCYDLPLNGLEYGNYRIIVVANSTRTALTGDPVQAANLVLTYPGVADTEDFFTAVYDFEVAEEQIHHYDIGLLRTHGAIRYTFVNMPQEVAAFEVVMENLAARKWVTADYADQYECLHRYSIVIPNTRQAGTDEEYLITTFPTLTGGPTTYTLNLYRDGEDEPYISQQLRDDLEVTRNQLLQLDATFNDGKITCVVNLDSDWTGSLPTPGTELD